DEVNAPAKLVDFEPTLKVGKVWSSKIGSGLDEAGRQLRPVFADGNLYAADYKGLVTSLDASTGRKNWEVKTELPFSGGPGISNNLLFMGTENGEVFAFDATSGSQLWSA